MPDCTIADAPDDFAALILVGGTNWWDSEAEAVLPLIRRALEKSAVLGAICDASMFLGVHGFLNSIPHTSNSLEVLKEKAGRSYTGEKLYREGCPAVLSGRIVTASGAGFSDFALLLFGALEAGSPEAIAKVGEIFRKGIFDPRDLEHTPE